jgi:hypothetical protein
MTRNNRTCPVFRMSRFPNPRFPNLIGPVPFSELNSPTPPPPKPPPLPPDCSSNSPCHYPRHPGVPLADRLWHLYVFHLPKA